VIVQQREILHDFEDLLENLLESLTTMNSVLVMDYEEGSSHNFEFIFLFEKWNARFKLVAICAIGYIGIFVLLIQHDFQQYRVGSCVQISSVP